MPQGTIGRYYSAALHAFGGTKPRGQGQLQLRYHHPRKIRHQPRAYTQSPRAAAQGDRPDRDAHRQIGFRGESMLCIKSLVINICNYSLPIAIGLHTMNNDTMFLLQTKRANNYLLLAIANIPMINNSTPTHIQNISL